jgi:hypothetical protein
VTVASTAGAVLSYLYVTRTDTQEGLGYLGGSSFPGNYYPIAGGSKTGALEVTVTYVALYS